MLSESEIESLLDKDKVIKVIAERPNIQTKTKGELAEAIVLTKLLKKGYSVSLPFGNNQRYDFIIDNNGALTRVQCKVGRVVNGSIRAKLTSTHSNYLGSRTVSYTREEIDAFVIYCFETDSAHLISLDELDSMTEIVLRIAPASNNQSIGIRWAKQYLV